MKTNLHVGKHFIFEAACLLFVILVALGGCSTSVYYTGELKPSDLVGTWLPLNPHTSSESYPTVGPGAVLILHANGKFEAEKFPYVGFHDHLEYTSMVGAWKLEDEARSGRRSRWRLMLSLGKFNETVE